jgi:hypothetical protein
MMFGNIPFARYAKSYYSHFYNTKRTYYETFYKVVDVDQLLSKSISDIRHFRKTAAPIQILNIPFDTTPEKLCKLLGPPKFKRIEAGPSTFERTTFFYRRPFFSDKAIFQFNFLNEVFSSCVVTFVQYKNSNQRLFLKIIEEKYLRPEDGGRDAGRDGGQNAVQNGGQVGVQNGAQDRLQDQTLKASEGIIDTQGNVILYEENVYSSLVYVNAAMAHKNIEEEVDEKMKLADLVYWKKHYQNWSDNL